MKKTLIYYLISGALASSAAMATELDRSPQFGNNNAQTQQPLYNNGQQPQQVQMPVNAGRPQPNGVTMPQGGAINPTTNPTMPAYADKELMSRKQVRDRAFEEFVEENTPFTDEQIRKLNGIKENNMKARQESTNTPPEPTKGEAVVSFDVGTEIPVISLDKDNVTTLVFTDKNNYKWEVLSAEVGNKASFAASEPIKNVQTNAVSLTTAALSGITNLTVWLKDAPTALQFTLVAGQSKVNYSFNVTVNTDGPNTPVMESFERDNIGKAFSDSEDFKLMKQGVIPKGLRALNLSGNNTGRLEAYMSRDGKSIYLRTSMKLIAPDYVRGGRLLDNDLVYQIPKAEIISFMHNGRNVDVTVHGIPMSSYR